MTPQDV
jgi:stress response protein YsnF